MVMLVGVGVGAQSTFDSNSNSSVGQDTYDGGVGQDTYKSGVGQDTYDSGVGQDYYGTSSSLMIGDKDTIGGSTKKPPTLDLGPKTTSYGPSENQGVPKLSLAGIVLWLVSIMNQLVYVIIGAALVMFLYGILKLSFVDGQKPEAREQARKFMFWGIVSLFVMVSVWGLVRIFQFTLFGSGNLILPQFK